MLEGARLTLARCGRAVAAAALAWSCMARGPVTRVADGETLEGRPIAPEAYAAYLRGSVLESRGDARGALAEFERALDADSSSPEIVTRIAALLCRSAAGPAAVEEALGNFDDALSLDPEYAPAWLELSTCLARSGKIEQAIAAAERSVAYDPLNPRATRTVARLLFAQGRTEEGFTWLEALVTLLPESPAARRALLEEAAARGSEARVARGRRALGRLGRPDRAQQTAELDESLARGDLEHSRKLAVTLSISPSELALRALATSPAAALEQAELVLAADPSDSDAWIAALAALDMLGDDAGFDTTLRQLGRDPLVPSARARAILVGLLARRVGGDARDALGVDE